MSTYDLETTIQLPDEEDVDVYIEFEVTHWGSSGVGPSLNYPGDPPEPAEFYIAKVVRLDNEKDITSEVDALPEKSRQKIEELVFNRVCEIAEDRDSYDYDE
jgi:hypothetical protein